MDSVCHGIYVHSSLCERAVFSMPCGLSIASMVILEERVGFVCTGVVVFHRSMVRLEEGVGSFCHWVSVHSSICET